MIIVDWFFATLKQYPEIAIFLTLGLGYYFGKFTFKGIGLGAVTATLLAGVLIGQIGITIAQPLKATVFLMFLFAVGYAVGPQFVRGVARDGLPQAAFSVVQCVLSLLACVVIAKIAGYDLGYAAGLYSGSQTISAAMGLSTDAINRLGQEPDQCSALAFVFDRQQFQAKDCNVLGDDERVHRAPPGCWRIRWCRLAKQRAGSRSGHAGAGRSSTTRAQKR